MKRLLVGLAIMAIGAAGCSPEFWGGGATGAAGTGAAYELRSRQQMEKLKDDLDSGRIDEREYEIRKDQIQKGSLVYSYTRHYC
jgi:hypothetical protein